MYTQIEGDFSVHCIYVFDPHRNHCAPIFKCKTQQLDRKKKQRSFSKMKCKRKNVNECRKKRADFTNVCKSRVFSIYLSLSPCFAVSIDLLMSGIFIFFSPGFDIQARFEFYDDDENDALNTEMKCSWFSIWLFISRALFFLFLLFGPSLLCFSSARLQFFIRDEVCASLYFSGQSVVFPYILSVMCFIEKRPFFHCVHICMHGQCDEKKNTRVNMLPRELASNNNIKITIYRMHKKADNIPQLWTYVMRHHESWFIVSFDIQRSCMHFNHTARLDFPTTEYTHNASYSYMTDISVISIPILIRIHLQNHR